MKWVGERDGFNTMVFVHAAHEFYQAFHDILVIPRAPAARGVHRHVHSDTGCMDAVGNVHELVLGHAVTAASPARTRYFLGNVEVYLANAVVPARIQGELGVQDGDVAVVREGEFESGHGFCSS